jgi:Flp pilus assembly protein TadG
MKLRNPKDPSRLKNFTRGHAVVEFALMVPWIVFLFIGVLDFGFYAYAAISVENAARVAALYTANNGTGAVTDTAGACYYVLQELEHAPNMGSGVSTCGGTSPVTVTAAAATVGGQPASQVSVTYKALPMIPIPGLLRGTFNFTRIVAARQ